MGSADLVPGVSGGTIALVLGIYERLIRAIHTGASAVTLALSGKWKEAVNRFRATEWQLLAPLLAGILLAVASLSTLLEHLLERAPQNTSALFFGLVVGSISITWRFLSSWTPWRIVGTVIMAVTTFATLGLRSEEIVDPAAALFLGAGAIAIIAMVLPGISGSFILLMLGMYGSVLSAINDRQFALLGLFLLGAIVSLGLFSTLLDQLLRRYRDTAMALLIGLMSGSLRVLWPWPDGTETSNLAAPESLTAPILLAFAGVVLVISISQIGSRRTASDIPKINQRTDQPPD